MRKYLIQSTYTREGAEGIREKGGTWRSTLRAERLRRQLCC